MEKFWSQALFYNKRSRKLSFREIAEKQNISISTAKRRIKRDIENGYISRERTKYHCKKYKTPLQGRNIYHTTPVGEKLLPQRVLKKRTLLKKSLLSNPNKKASKPSSMRVCGRNVFSKNQQKTLERLGFSHLVGKAPGWWFRSQKNLERTLLLLKRKRAQGYKVKDEVKWTSACLGDGGRGFGYKKAKEVALAVANNPLLPGNKWVKNTGPAHTNLLLSLTLLTRKGLKLSFDWAQRFLRKGAATLQLAMNACLKALKRGRVRNLNSFLNWLVSLKEPFEIFKKKGERVLKQETAIGKRKREQIQERTEAIERALQSARQDNRIDLFDFRRWKETVDFYEQNPQLKMPIRVFFRKVWGRGSAAIFEVFFQKEGKWLKSVIDPSQKNAVQDFFRLWTEHLFAAASR